MPPPEGEGEAEPEPSPSRSPQPQPPAGSAAAAPACRALARTEALPPCLPKCAEQSGWGRDSPACEPHARVGQESARNRHAGTCGQDRKRPRVGAAAKCSVLRLAWGGLSRAESAQTLGVGNPREDTEGSPCSILEMVLEAIKASLRAVWPLPSH